MSGLINKNKNTCSLIFDKIETYEDIENDNNYVNLWDYGEFEDKDTPIIFRLGRTAVNSELNDTS